jgi:hypothetical protein
MSAKWAGAPPAPGEERALERVGGVVADRPEDRDQGDDAADREGRRDLEEQVDGDPEQGEEADGADDRAGGHQGDSIPAG